MRRTSLTLLLISLSITFAAGRLATACGCDSCGCDDGCRKVCHLKCDKKKVTKVKWEVECEDFCVPCKGECCGTKCECECETDCHGCKHEVCHKKQIQKPTGAVVHTRKKLIKKEETKEVPVYKWTVETVCDRCVHRCRCCENGESAAAIEAAALASDQEATIEPSVEAPADAPSSRRVRPAMATLDAPADNQQAASDNVDDDVRDKKSWLGGLFNW